MPSPCSQAPSEAVFAIKSRLEPSDDLVFTVREPLLMMVTMPNTILRRIIPILMTGMLTMQMMMLTTHAVFSTFRVELLQCKRCSSLSPRADTTTVLNALHPLEDTTLLLHLFYTRPPCRTSSSSSSPLTSPTRPYRSFHSHANRSTEQTTYSEFSCCNAECFTCITSTKTERGTPHA